MPPISHRLSSSMYERWDDENKEAPKKIVFLSLEGSITERDYFSLMNKYKTEMGIKSHIHMEILGHDFDTSSGINNVFELLNETLQLRKYGISEKDLSALSEIHDGLSTEKLKSYLEGKLPEEECGQIDEALHYLKYDLRYQKYLQALENGENENDDVYAMVIDRDKGSHHRDKLKDIIHMLALSQMGHSAFIEMGQYEFIENGHSIKTAIT